ncbi:hypothetical protein HN924_00875 [Candidatus Woesearchaeota archaeon]|jgi:hypothetical protein|nr:hypothetical protein [Candidatus Woesearchaeota archaeon]MBT7062507.1 hypothetical protein [Candidatus Woesearchaeota archaeon]MBT7402552.1 hypothetical protein [Candidatus Woesearchaeota archaeon]
MSIFPNYFKEAILEKDIKKVESATEKMVDDIPKIYDGYNIWAKFNREDINLFRKLKKIYNETSTPKEKVVARKLLFLIKNISINIQLHTHPNAKNSPDKFHKYKQLHKEIQDLLDTELSFDKMIQKNVKWITLEQMEEQTKYKGLAYADGRGVVYLVKKLNELPPKLKKHYARYLKIHEIMEHRATSIPRIIDKYGPLLDYVFAKLDANEIHRYREDMDGDELIHYFACHTLATYEEFLAAKKDGLLDQYNQYNISHFREMGYNHNKRGKLWFAHREATYKFVKITP